MNIFTRYYRIQASRGVDRATATILLPIKAINHLRLIKRYPRGVIYGYGLFDRPLLASYSRSGTNWIRYIIEYLSSHPTPGQKRLLDGNDYYIDRAHCAFPRMKRYKKVLLILRDYRECLLRHHSDIWPEYGDVVSFLEDDSISQPASWYIRNISAFDSFKGPKLLIYYEDLLSEPQKSIIRLANFLDLDERKTDEFLQNIDDHTKRSVSAYKRGGHSSETTSTRDLKYHARTKLTPDQIDQFDEFFFSRYERLSTNYLSRYRAGSR